jgi:ribosomal protein S18 acetylase RimI-like enzyme
MQTTIHTLSAGELEAELAAFVHLLKDAVDHGASLGFFAPLDLDAVRAYWLSLRDDLRRGTRLLLAARAADGGIVGTGQLVLPPLPSSRHRVELQKLIVDFRVRGSGIGARLMDALHAAALARGRSLIVLGTRSGERPERFYKRLGYRVAGSIPGYTTDGTGRRYVHTTLYLDLHAPVEHSC